MPSNPRSKAATKAKLIKWLRKNVFELTEVDREVEFCTNGSEVVMFVNSQGFLLDINPDEWNAWGANVTREWWSVSAPYTSKAVIDGEEVQSSFLRSDFNLISSDSEQALYLKAGGPPLTYVTDNHGLLSVDFSNPIIGGTCCVSVSSSVTAKNILDNRIELETLRTKYPKSSHQDSRTRYGQLLIEEVKQGIYKDTLNNFSSLIRSFLPQLKAGVPSVRDVKSKMELEVKLRREEAVTGSLRPLALTLEALEGEDENDTNYPGLWLLSSDSFKEECDIRSHFNQLLLWDSVLYILASAVKFHGEFKSGILLGDIKEPSRTVYLDERRYSKKNSGEVISHYVQLSPTRIFGNSSAIAMRLIQLGTHELAHLTCYSNIEHGESFVAKRESYLNLAAGVFNMILTLVENAGISQQKLKIMSEKTIALEQVLAEELSHKAVSFDFLVKKWAAIKNISVNKAEEEVRQELANQESMARLDFSEKTGIIVAI